MIYEKIVLKKGVNESRGMVRLNSESLIALRKKIAEKTPTMIKVIPGNKYGRKLIEKFS